MAEITYTKYREMADINHGAMAGILRVVSYQNDLPAWLRTAAADALADYSTLRTHVISAATHKMIEDEG